MKKNTRKTFYLMTFFAIAAMVAMSFLVLPNFNSSGTVSAQKAEVNTEVATADMIAIATNIKSAGSFAVFADRGISDTGLSQIKGDVGVAGKGAQVNLDSAVVQGNSYVDPSDALRAQKDLAASFNALNQLPCQELADSELGGKRFTPGVYCVSSARLAGQAIMDAQNDPSGVFIFRVSGSFNTKTGSSIELANRAVPGNVYFVASDSVNVGNGSSIKASIFAENDVKVADGSTINGRILSLKGGVSLSNDSVQLADGFIEICKVVDPNGAGNGDLVGRIFRFTVPGVNGGNFIEVQANQCAGPFLVPGAGNVVVTEDNNSRLPGSATLRAGNFQLTNVTQINVQQGAANAVTGFNLPLRTANVTVPMGGINDGVTVQFTNQFAIVGFIEICKNGMDSDTTGTFTFTVAGVPQQTSNPSSPLQQFTVPTGLCGGLITVTAPSNGTGTPRTGTVQVTELARVGFFFVTATTDPSERLQSIQIVNSNTVAGRVNATIFEAGDARNQTRINFFNRTNAAQVKVCKIAGAGIPEGTVFNFTVSGFAPVFGGDGAFTQQAISRNFNVAAGLSANNGGCRFVPTGTGVPASNEDVTRQNFVVGTDVTVTENGPLTIGGDEVRVGRITSSSSFTSVGSDSSCNQGRFPPSSTSGPNIFFPLNGTCRTVVVPVRSREVVVEYTNFRFAPGQLKICKIAGRNVPLDNSPTAPSVFTFDVTFDRLQGFIPGAVRTETITLTVPAGPAAQGGFCRVVNGPFGPNFGGFGTFNVGSVVTVTERAEADTNVTGIRTTSGGPITANLAGRSAQLTMLAGTQQAGGPFTLGTTEVEFTNSAVQAEPLRASTAYDFDGDLKADISVFRDGNWYLNRSKDGFTARQFGSTGDKLVSADYDGDGKADIAVFRADATKGYFYILNSSTGNFSWTQFGVNSDVAVVGDYDGDKKADIAVYRDGKNAGDPSYIYYRPSGTPGADFVTIQLGAKGDIPVVGDYDADGKTDAAVYRPSNGTWYMLRSTAGFTGMQFGISTDVPVPADFDGDGKTDVAVYRGGTWYIMQSSKGFTGVQFGMATDMPVPADIDGDGKDDITVFRGGTWYWLNSKDGSFQGINFGLGTDIPVFCPAVHQ